MNLLTNNYRFLSTALVVSVLSGLIFAQSYDVLRVSALLCLSAFAICNLLNEARTSILDMTLILSWTLVGFLGAIYSDYPAYSLAVLAYATLFLVVLLPINRSSWLSQRHLEEFISIFLIVASVLIILGLSYQVANVVTTGLLDGAFMPIFNNQRHYNQVQSLITPLLIAVGLIKSFKWYVRLFFFVLAVGSCWLMLLTGGRGVVLSLLFSVITVAVLFPRFRWRLLSIFVLVVCATLVVYLLFDHLSSASLPERYTSAHTSGRLELWLESMRLAVSEFPLGVGFGLFGLENQTRVGVAHPHNTFFWILSEGGVIALLSFLIIAGRFIADGYRRSDRDDSITMILAFCLISGFCYSLFGGLALMPLSSIMLAVLVLAWQGVLKSANSIPLPKPHRHLKVIQFCYKVVVGLAVLICVITALVRFTPMGDVFSYQGNGPIWPGFWFNGRFWDNL